MVGALGRIGYKCRMATIGQAGEIATLRSGSVLEVLGATLLVSLAKRNLLAALQRSAVRIKRASGAVLILAGLYLGYYYLAAGM